VVEIYPDENGLDEVLLHLLPADNNDECDYRIRAHLKANYGSSPNIIYVPAEEMQRNSISGYGEKSG